MPSCSLYKYHTWDSAYEPNNTCSRAYGLLIPGQEYGAFPQDTED
jgi:hypothetical protein